MKINIDVSSWNKEYNASAPITNEEELLDDAIKNSPQCAARKAIVAREKKDAPSDILQDNSILLNDGGAMELSEKIAQKKITKVLKNGLKLKVKKFVGRQGNKTGDSSYAKSGSPKALENATANLHGPITNYFRNSLLTIHVSDGDVKKVWATFKKDIDDFIETL